MAQLNLDITDEFDRDPRAFMKQMGLKAPTRLTPLFRGEDDLWS